MKFGWKFPTAAAATRLGFLLLLSLSLFVASCAPSASARDTVSQAAADCDNCIAGLRGNVVYQRPDGIYWHPLGATRSRLLHPGGTWPRWSPDGRAVAFIAGNKILLKRLDGEEVRILATAKGARALAFFAHGNRLAFTDGNAVKALSIDSGEVETLVDGWRFLEIDLSPDGERLAATVKQFGYSVRVFDLKSGKERKIAKGCSASFSPNGALVTTLFDSHDQLALREADSGKLRRRVSAPRGFKFDNQTWSNHPDWLVSVSEGSAMRVYAHHIPSNRAFPISVDKDCDRPDLYLESG